MTIATPHATNAHPRPAVPFQQVLLLCVPALIIGLVRRVDFLTGRKATPTSTRRAQRGLLDHANGSRGKCTPLC